MIENLFTKEDCFNFVPFKKPILYEQGFIHNNCLGCVKSSSPVYWDKVRKLYKDVYLKRCKQSRELNVISNF